MRIAPVGTNDPMTMILSPIFKYIAIIFLFLATAVGAQENGRSPLDQVVPVADEGLDDEDLATAIGPTAEELLAEEFARYKELALSGVLDEAENTAKRIIELQIRISGPASTGTAKALTNLAIIRNARLK